MIALHTAVLTAFISLEQWRCGFRCRFGWPLVQLKSGMILPRGLSAEGCVLAFSWRLTAYHSFGRQIRDFISPTKRQFVRDCCVNITASWRGKGRGNHGPAKRTSTV